MKKLIFILIFSAFLITPCYAAPYDDSQLHDSLPDYADELVGDTAQSPQDGLSRLGSAFPESARDGLGERASQP